ncbi:MAG: hypothetical protein ACK41O_11655 [Runella zeae]
MKKVIAIGLLLLLLYNMFGLTVALLFFEEEFRNASPTTQNDQWKTFKVPIPTLPYNTAWENQEGEEGLIREGENFYNIMGQRHENDTLYITLKTNRDAHERFVELSERVQELMDLTSQSSQSPLNKALKLLYELTKIYLFTSSFILTSPSLIEVDSYSLRYERPNQSLLTSFCCLLTPPPEQGYNILF